MNKIPLDYRSAPGRKVVNVWDSVLATVGILGAIYCAFAAVFIEGAIEAGEPRSRWAVVLLSLFFCGLTSLAVFKIRILYQPLRRISSADETSASSR